MLERDWERLFRRLATIAQIEREAAFGESEMIRAFSEMRSVLLTADIAPTPEDGEAVVERLGIDVKAWAADVRERVKAATEGERERPETEARMGAELLDDIASELKHMSDAVERLRSGKRED